MRQSLIACVFVLVTAACASAQTYTGFAWNQGAPDAATAQSYVMRAYFDGAVPALNGTVLTSVVCAGTASPWLCSAVCSGIPTGKHTAQLTTGAADNSVESTASAAVSFNQAPATPTGVALKK